jgi:hypothetical protein
VRSVPLGSITFDRRTSGHEQLVNIPVDRSQPVAYYGDDGIRRKKIKGTLNPAAPNR